MVNATPPDPESAGSPGDGSSPDEQAIDLAELWRIEWSLTAVASEVRELKKLDDASLRKHVAALERGWRSELEGILPEPLIAELHRLLDWLGKEDASEAELRIGLAQLEGWVDGLLSGMGVLVVRRQGP